MPEGKKKTMIYPLAYELHPDMVCTLYYQGFPARWKTKLLEFFRVVKPNMKDEYGLPTDSLKKMILAWMDGVVNMNPLKKFTDDRKWLTSCTPYDDRELQRLCQFVKIWCKVVFSKESNPRVPFSLSQSVEEFCGTMQWTEFKNLQTQANVSLTMADGTVSGEAYGAIPLLAVNQLLGKAITLQGRELRLSYAGKNELISQPLEEPKSHNQYSFVFTFSLQTTPPDRHALLLCHMSIRRWIYAPWDTNEDIYPDDMIQAYIQTSQNKFCQVNIWGSFRKKETGWFSRDEQCYNICDFEPLPVVQDVLKHPADFASRILLPYKNGMKGFAPSKIGTGIPVLDKAILHGEIQKHLGEIVAETEPVAVSIGHRKNIPMFESPTGYRSREEFRGWVKSCTETNEIVFELYGMLKNENQKKLLDQIRDKIREDFGENMEGSCMKIQILQKEIGDIVSEIEIKDIRLRVQDHIKRSRHIEKTLGPSNHVTGCVVVIPTADSYSPMGDPKQAVRNGFALTGRVVQFINPPADDKETNTAKIAHCVYDLYRQLGLVTLIDFSKKQHPLLSVPCVGLHICTQVHSKARKARFMPVSVRVDLQTGKTRVFCDAFTRQNISYREACLEMAQLFWKEDLEAICVEASRQPAKQLLLQMKNMYRSPEEKAMLLVVSDGNTRPLWNGISDKEIGEYDLTQEYCPKSINAGKKNSPFPMELLGTGIRIIRIRTNQEVPDYYTGMSSKSTEDKAQRESNSGVFRYGETYWRIAPRSSDMRYITSFKDSRIDYPKKDYAEKDMTEIYPMQLQCEDLSSDWVFYADALCALPLQYSMSTVLPLPLHLAKGLEEYLFDI